MTTPTKAEIQAALDTLRRATGDKAPNVAQALAMTDAELEAAGIGPDDLIRLAAAAIPEADR